MAMRSGRSPNIPLARALVCASRRVVAVGFGPTAVDSFARRDRDFAREGQRDFAVEATVLEALCERAD